MHDFKVGDRMRAVSTRGSGDIVTHEFTVTKVTGTSVESSEWYFYLNGPYADEAVEYTLLKRAPLAEPKGVGAIFSFDDPLEGLRHVAVRLGSGLWVDEDSRVWAWKVISENNPMGLREGLGEEPL